MHYEFDGESRKSSSARIFWIFLAVVLVTAGVIFLLVRSGRETGGNENPAGTSAPAGEVSNVPPVEEINPVGGAETDLLNGNASGSGAAVSGDEQSVEVEEEKGKSEEPLKVEAGPAENEDVPTEEPEKGKPWIGDFKETPLKRPAGLTGEAAEDFRTKVTSALEKEDENELRRLVAEAVENSEDYIFAGEALGKLSMKNYVSGGRDFYSYYQVGGGDNLSRISRKLKVTADSLIYLNNIKNANLIKWGQRLKYVPGVFSVRISKEARILKLYRDGKLFKIYEIGVGRQGRTPLGKFTVGEKLKTPVWYPGDGREVSPDSEENQLGTRYIALNNAENRPTGYGIHGSRDESTVGKSLSHGCIRMKNAEVEELYMLLPINSEILIEK